MYPQPKVAAAVTGRVLYSDPNAQGIDKKKTDEFRRCVRAEDGRAIVKGDFAQQELRIAAYYSRDKNMLDDLREWGGHLPARPLPSWWASRWVRTTPRVRLLRGRLWASSTASAPRSTARTSTRTPESASSASQANKDREAFRAAFPEFYRWQQTYGAKHEWETRSALGWRRVVAPDNGQQAEVHRKAERAHPVYGRRHPLPHPKEVGSGSPPRYPLSALGARRAGPGMPRRRMPEESHCGSRRRCARPWRRSWAKSLVDRSLQRSAMVRAGESAWSWRRCFNNIKNNYPELRVRDSLTEDGTQRTELVRA